MKKEANYEDMIIIARGQNVYKKRKEEKTLLQQYLEDRHPLFKESINKEINNV